MSKKSLLLIAAIEIILAAGWFLWYKPNKAQGGDIVRDLSGYMKTYPGESMQAQREKQGYNLNQYLNQQDRQTQDRHANTLDTFRRNLDTGRSVTDPNKYGGMLCPPK